jgi:hypothetical protein
MTELNQKLLDKNIVLKEIKNITPQTRKQIKVWLGVDIKNYYYLLVEVYTKSRFIQKNAKDLIEFVTPLTDINFKKNKKIVFIKSDICGKSKELLKNSGWRIL